ncbi:MAG: Na+/H+ antiporter NhaC family protein [Bacteroidales bacterium]|nr:Na+/H+ antiporter NhaC family protein [Bacteroidales bacterium]
MNGTNYRSVIFFLLFFSVVFIRSVSSLFAQGDTSLINEQSVKIKTSELIIQHIPSKVIIEVTDIQLEGKFFAVEVNDTAGFFVIEKGICEIPVVFSQKQTLKIRSGSFEFQQPVTPIPLWMSILPPLIAIMMALLLREVFSALFLGLLVGSVIICFYQGDGFFMAVFNGIFAMIDTYILESLADTDHLSIIVFSMMIGAMVALISDNGGMRGIVNKLAKHADNVASGQFVTWLLGIAIFFDDYANTLVVGNTMRPVTDRLKISREKLSYIVDSTAAPIAAIAFVTTWIGAELSYIQDGINTIGLNETAYNVFLSSLSYSFYPLLAIAFILMLIFTGKDFGPMYKAEKNARYSKKQFDHSNTSDSKNGDQKKNERWYNAAIPVFVVVFGTVAGLVITGLKTSPWQKDISLSANLTQVIGHSDSFKALLWSSLAAIIVALFLTISQKILTLRQSMDSLVSGFKTMLTAVLILVLAWSVALVTEYLHTADFFSGLLVSIQISPFLIPALTFLLSALISFSTGSSWGTMAILYPLILPSCWMIAQDSGLDYNASMAVFYNVVSSVLAGSVLGDHCSPISDTTILSSLASSCNHIDHVRTQLPYALIVGAVAVLFGTIPAAYGIPFYLTLPLSIVILFLIVYFKGKKLNSAVQK